MRVNGVIRVTTVIRVTRVIGIISSPAPSSAQRLFITHYATYLTHILRVSAKVIHYPDRILTIHDPTYLTNYLTDFTNYPTT